MFYTDLCGDIRGFGRFTPLEVLLKKMIVMLMSKKEKLLAMCQNSLLPGQLKERLASLIEERARILEG